MAKATNRRPDTATRTGHGAAPHILPRVQLDQDVYTLAKERARIAAHMHDKLIVAFSGGKDSTAVLNVTLEVLREDPELAAKHLPLRVVHADEECIPIQTEEYVRRVSQLPDVALEWYCLPFKMRNACSREHPEWWTWAPEEQDKWARPMPPEGITDLAGFPLWPPEDRLSWPETNELLTHPSMGNVCLLMGIRAQESLTRARALAVASQREYNWLVKQGGHNTALSGTSAGNVWKGYIIYDWQTEDVWRAPAILGWDYNRAYDLMEMAGIGPKSQRCSPAFGEEPIGKLHVFAEAFPEVWAKMSERVPGVGAAYRYSRTELYGYGKRPARPDDMDWQQFIRHYVSQHPAKLQPQLARRLSEMIRAHYRVTTHPIVVDAAHPDTGLSWNFLLMVAMRGDTKERKQPTHRCTSDPVKRAAMWQRYTEELAAIQSAGDMPSLAYPRKRLPGNPYDLIPPEFRELRSAT